MDNIKQIVTYLLLSTENKQMQNLRLTQMVYLMDWKNCLVSGDQITGIKWELNTLGPFSSDIIKSVAHSRSNFVIDYSISGEIDSVNTLIKLTSNPIDVSLMELSTKRALDFVIGSTSVLDHFEFISFIFSTFPVVKSKRFTSINLKSLSKEYKSSRFWNDKSSNFDLL